MATVEIVAMEFLIVGAVVAQAPVKNVNPKPLTFRSPTGATKQHFLDAAKLLTTALTSRARPHLATDKIASPLAIVANLWAKLSDGTIGLAKRPVGINPQSRAGTLPNRKDATGTAIFDGGDPGNSISIWDDQWNPDGTFKVPNVKSQSRAISPDDS